MYSLREGDGEGGRKRENVSMAAESGGFFSSSKLELQQRGLLVNAVCHDSRKKENPNA